MTPRSSWRQPSSGWSCLVAGSIARSRWRGPSRTWPGRTGSERIISQRRCPTVPRSRKPSRAMPPWPERFARRPRDRLALLRLATLHSIQPRRLHELAVETGTASGCVDAILGGRLVGDADRTRLRRADPATVQEELDRCGARLVVPGHREYPPSLEDLADPPAMLFVKGHPLDGLVPRGAVGGARNS